MKRLWTTPGFIAGQRIRLRKLDRRRRNARRRRSIVPSRRHPDGGAVSGVRSEQELHAPNVLSLFDEPDDTITFLNSLRTMLSGQGARVFLDLSEVNRFTNDALLLLRAIMDSPVRALYNNVGGNLPRDPKVATEFKASGFFAGFAKPPGDLPPAKGLMKKKSANTVHSEHAADLVDFALKHVNTTETCAMACYRNLVEVMTNTHNHAANQRSSKRMRHGRERWHASVYCRNGIAYFSFVDLGVGILQSARVKRFLRKTAISISSQKRAVLLKDVFEGKIGSATEKPGRGRGLPKMKRDVDDGSLVDLKILTSDVAGSVASLDFTSVGPSLRGTAFRWQVGQEGG